MKCVDNFGNYQYSLKIYCQYVHTLGYNFAYDTAYRLPFARMIRKQRMEIHNAVFSCCIHAVVYEEQQQTNVNVLYFHSNVSSE